MAATLGNIASTTANATLISWSHIVAPGADKVLVVILSLDGVSQGLNVIWQAAGGDQGLTFLMRALNLGIEIVEIWYLVNPDVETANILATVNIKAQHGAGSADYSGAGTPDGDVSNAQDAVTSTSVDITTAGADDQVIDVGRHPSGSPTPGANQTIIINTGAGGERVYGSTQDGADGGVMSWSWPSAQDQAQIGCRVPAAANGGIPIAIAEHHHRAMRTPL